jgi:mRNA interferase MazF
VTAENLPAPSRGEVWWVETRPCLVLTSSVLNRLRQTVVVVPYSTGAGAHPPLTVPVTCQGKGAVAVVDQVRAIARHRLRSRVEVASQEDLASVGEALARILEL